MQLFIHFGHQALILNDKLTIILSLSSTFKKSNINSENALIFLKVGLLLQRRSGVYLLNILTPGMTLSLMLILVFCIPVDMGGDRLAFIFTVMLSGFVFMVDVGDSVPSSARYIPHLGERIVVGTPGGDRKYSIVNMLLIFFVPVRAHWAI